MARPGRQGVDYFPLDVHLDDKFKFIEIKYKLEGFAIIVKLIQKIYSYGYWYQWGEDEALLFSDEVKANVETVKNVIDESIQREIFNKELYDKYKILTSKGIQKRYEVMVKRRKDVEVITEYKLIDDTFGANEIIINEIVNIMSTPCQHDVYKSTQSKLNQTKLNETKLNEINIVEETSPVVTVNSIINSFDNKDFRQALKDFKEHRTAIKSKLTVKALKMLLNKLDTLAKDDVTKIKILNESVLNGWKGVFPLNQNNYKKGIEATVPEWMDKHEEYRRNTKTEVDEVDPNQLQELLNTFKK